TGTAPALPNISSPARNLKDESKYLDKDVFLISDGDWHNVLELVPVAIWTETDVIHKYPLLVYQQEGNSFDADSAVHFLQKYKPSRVILVGSAPSALEKLLTSAAPTGASLSASQVMHITPDEYLTYWKNSDIAVISGNDYETALAASVYASLINTPLIIDGGNGKSLPASVYKICVGTVSADCNEHYTLEQLQAEYINKTNTNKVILVNPADLGIFVQEELVPNRSAGSLHKIYSKTSLLSPILASAKHELLLTLSLSKLSDTAKEQQITDRANLIDLFLQKKLNSLNVSTGYLTIMATPDAIENGYYYKREADSSYYLLANADTAKYSSQDNDTILEFATGRIFGITVTDVSSYLARDIFWGEIENGNAILLLAADSIDVIGESMGYKKVYSAYGNNVDSEIDHGHQSPKPEPGKYIGKSFIQFKDHGNFEQMGRSFYYELPELDNTLFLTGVACRTCIYGEFKKPTLYCMQAIRKGASGYIGMFVGGGLMEYQYFVSALTNNLTIGDALKGSIMTHYSAGYVKLSGGPDTPSNGFGLIGDPTLKIKFANPFPRSQLIQKNESSYAIRLQVARVPVEFVSNYINPNKRLNFNTFISSPYSTDDMYVTTFKSYDFCQYPDAICVDRTALNGLVKVGPVTKGYQRVKFINIPSQYGDIGKIYSRAPAENGKEYLWISFERSMDAYDSFEYSVPVGNEFYPFDINFVLSK
ncbi:hypothetical protein COX84_04560, partial [Candidatus Micrarchaeota archaeon CG_4_10_14_0_2_um_filter_49_7]